MRADTITRAQAQLPATREELEQKLNLKPGSSQHVVKHMLRCMATPPSGATS